MLRNALLSTSLLLASCASTRTSELIVDDALPARVSASSAAVLPAEPVASPESAPAALPEPLAVPTFAPAEELYNSRFTVKGGYWGGSEDALDDGYIFGVSWMRFMSKLLALELEIGYFDADGSDSGTNFDVWSVPIMLNGRLNVPVWILDLYGGLGIGTYYYDAEASGAGSGSDDGFLMGGNAVLGASIGLADRISLGLEGKYYISEDVDDFNEGLDAFALMLTLGFTN